MESCTRGEMRGADARKREAGVESCKKQLRRHSGIEEVQSYSRQADITTAQGRDLVSPKGEICQRLSLSGHSSSTTTMARANHHLSGSIQHESYGSRGPWLLFVRNNVNVVELWLTGKVL